MRKKIDRPLQMQLSLVAAAVAAILNAPAAAVQIDVGNPDGELRFDNTIRYNAGWRMEKRDQVLADTWGLQGGEYKFDKGDLITNRIDLLTELDQRRRHGHAAASHHQPECDIRRRPQAARLLSAGRKARGAPTSRAQGRDFRVA